MTNLKPYPEYRKTDLAWLEEVPSHWRVQRAKNVFRSVDVRSEDGKERLLTVSSKNGIVPRDSTNVTMFKAESYAGYKLCWPDDLVVNSLWAWAKGLGVSQEHGIISSAYGVYRPSQELHPQYVHALVRSEPYNWELHVRSRGIWTSRLLMTDESFLAGPFLVPPLEEQEAIVRFLDYVDRRVQRYIDAKQKLISLLEEQKQAIIHQAVTRGLDPDVPLKPSGVEWLGDIPEHWETRRAKGLFREIDERSQDGSETLLSLRMHAGLVPHDDVSDVPIGPADIIGYKKIKPGVLVMNRMRAAIGLFGVPRRSGLVSPDYAVFQPIAGAMPEYYLKLFKTDEAMGVFRVESKGLGTGSSGFMRLYTDRFGQIEMPLPPRSEQENIVSALAKRTQLVDGAARSAKHASTLMNEYRTRLIADVVTGKLDVREAAAAIPEESDDPALLFDSADIDGVDELLGDLTDSVVGGPQ